jgi:precorrin-6A/cobalt-precorrin-6A reductase
MILLLGGTTEANTIGDLLKTMHLPFILTVTSDYGVQMAKRHGEQVIQRTFTEEEMTLFMKGMGIRLLIDSTHPHASVISSLAQRVSKALNCPYMRYERPASIPIQNEHLSYVETPEAAAILSRRYGKRIFITGSKHISLYQRLIGDLELFVRVLPSPPVIAEVLAIGIPPDHIVAMKGPFSEALNQALFEAFHIDVLITKESGETGGYLQKVQGAQESGIHTIVIKRPHVTYGAFVHSLEALRSWLNSYPIQGENNEI